MRMGIALDVTIGGAALADLARRAESAGIELLALVDQGEHLPAELAGSASEPGLDSGPAVASTTGRESPLHHDLDLWTTAVWLLGRTSSITVAVPDLSEVRNDEASPLPQVQAQALIDASLLAPGRVHSGGWQWLITPDQRPPSTPISAEDQAALVQRAELLAGEGLPVLVPVRTSADLERAAALLPTIAAIAAPTRSSRVRAQRGQGIAYDQVPEVLAANAVEPGDPAYPSVSHTYMRAGSPGLVLRPQRAREVGAALEFADRHRHLPLSLRSGGHGISGRSTNRGGLIIDLKALHSIEVVDIERRLVQVGAGATWKQVAAVLDQHGWAIGSGDYGGVGVGGLATAGGIGFLSRAHGLTIDAISAIEMTLADGTEVRTDARHHEELFWGVRGAGANLGVVTAVEFEASPVGPVGWAQLTVVVDDLAQGLAHYGRTAQAAPRDTSVFLITGAPQGGRGVLQLYGMVESGDPEVVRARLEPFVALGSLVQQQASITRYGQVMGLAADVGTGGHQGFGEPHARSGFLPEMTREYATDLTDVLRTGQVSFLQFRAMGGAIADIAADATAFGHRDVAFSVSALGRSSQALDEVWRPLHERHHRGLYLSFETDQSPDRLAEAFPPATLRRLRALKERVDPTGLFRDNFPIITGTDALSTSPVHTPVEESA